MNKLIISVMVFLCVSACANAVVNSTEMETTTIIGSAEHPDPVLERVQELEKQGVIKDVIVMESFPVQIMLTGPKDVIEALRAMPRKVSPTFR